MVCYNDVKAIGVLHDLQPAGILASAQMSVPGFDNIIFSAYTNPPLTAFDQPKHFIVAEAARLVLGLLNVFEESTGPKIQTLKDNLLISGSTSRPIDEHLDQSDLLHP
jgi:LacI family repressor for deo operon, udp, cdd, tsx, nupC, and nupG